MTDLALAAPGQRRDGHLRSLALLTSALFRQQEAAMRMLRGSRGPARTAAFTASRDDDVTAGAVHDPDVHVDWHMLPDEWSQLQAVLLGELDPADSAYVQHLKALGALRDGGTP